MCTIHMQKDTMFTKDCNQLENFRACWCTSSPHHQVFVHHSDYEPHFRVSGRPTGGWTDNRQSRGKHSCMLSPVRFCYRLLLKEFGSPVLSRECCFCPLPGCSSYTINTVCSNAWASASRYNYNLELPGRLSGTQLLALVPKISTTLVP
jgi:hypothetical protein